MSSFNIVYRLSEKCRKDVKEEIQKVNVRFPAHSCLGKVLQRYPFSKMIKCSFESCNIDFTSINGIIYSNNSRRDKGYKRFIAGYKFGKLIKNYRDLLENLWQFLNDFSYYEKHLHDQIKGNCYETSERN